jgi:polyphosphate kinase 2 (PPK2 family)
VKGFDAPGDDKVLWRDHYRSISNLERHLHANGTRVVKFFFLHLSKEEQRKRFLARIDEPEKNRKFSTAEVEERKFWKRYMEAYEECLSATSTGDSPWYPCPPTTASDGRQSLTPFGVTTIGRLMRIGCAIMKSS